ncbi:hypothetical protein GCM10027589_09250 [Actinocorallia lasiicapitis]
MWKRMVVIGDSVAEGVREPHPGFADLSWTDRVAEALETEQLNLGERNLLAAQIRERQLAEAVAYRADLAFVLAGANDSFRRTFDTEGVERELETMIGALAEGGALVVTVGLFDIDAAGLAPEPLAGRIGPRLRELSALTEKITLRHGGLHVAFTDHPGSADPSNWSSDRIHLNAKGHALAADLTLAALFPTPW